MALIPDEFRVDVLGDEIDANGALIENINAKPKSLHLCLSLTGTQKRPDMYYIVLPTRPNLEGSTKTNTKEPKTETINGSRPACP